MKVLHNRGYRVIVFTSSVFIAITLFHLIKVPDVPEKVMIVPGLDKATHYLMFAILSLTIARCIAYYSIKNFNRTKLLICIISYAVLMEILQDKMTSYRSFEWGDLIADFFGIITGAWSVNLSILPFFFQHKIWKSS